MTWKILAFALVPTLLCPAAATGARPASTSPAASAEDNAAEDATGCPLDGPLAGAWAEEGGEGTNGEGTNIVRFDDRQVAAARDGRLDSVAQVVDCRPQRLETCAFGRRFLLEIHLDGDRLEIRYPATDTLRTFRRLAEVPEIFDPEPLALPAGDTDLPAERMEEIRRQLSERLERDQAVRQLPFDGPKMMQVDGDNTAYLKKLVAEVGWIDPQRFGEEAADAAFLIVQHSGDLPLMLAALPHLEAQHRQQEYALLYDRLQIRQGLLQRYGTQIGSTADGEKGLLPITTLDGIDALRAEMGLEPLDDYLARFDLHERHVLDCR